MYKDLDIELLYYGPESKLVHAGWNSWREASGVLCYKRVPTTLQEIFHKTVARPAMVLGLTAAPLKKTEENKMDVAEMRRLRWMS